MRLGLCCLFKDEKVILMGILSSFLVACSGEFPGNLGVKNGKLAACPGSPNCVSSQMADTGHFIAPLAFRDDPNVAFARVKEILKHRNDTTTIEEGRGYIRVEFRTRLFVDDGEFLLDPEQRAIHVRSASRLGYSDLGKNRSRMEEIRYVFSGSETQP
jgi:uncharacterized protein (DUF1499 family)